MPKVSVLMPVHNGEAFLELAVNSVLGQSLTDFELLIVDDGSTDNSPALISKLARQDPRIVAVSRASHGLVATLNHGLSIARADLVARLDCDDLAMPDRLQKQIDAFEHDPELGVLGSFAVHIDARGNSLRHQTMPLDRAEMLKIMEYEPILLHPAVMFRKAIVIDAGGYRPAYNACEDRDLWFRLIDVTKIRNLPEYLIHYRRHDNQVTTRRMRESLFGAFVAYHAYLARRDGLGDPTDSLASLPELEQLDPLFQKPGMAREFRTRLFETILSRPEYLASAEGFDFVTVYLDEQKRHGNAMIRERVSSCLRLIGNGNVAPAIRLALGWS